MIILKTELELFPGLGRKGRKEVRKRSKYLNFLVTLIPSDCLGSQGRGQIFMLSWVHTFPYRGSWSGSTSMSIVGKNEILEV